MSKQPRGSVRIGAGNSVGTRVSNIFVDVEKFQDRFQNARDKASANQSTESDSERNARSSAIQAIRSISNWLYWQSPIAGGRTSETGEKLRLTAKKSTQPNIKKLQEAVEARKNAKDDARPVGRVPVHNEAYWTPSTLALPQATQNISGFEAAAKFPPAKNIYTPNDEEFTPLRKGKKQNTLVRGIPMATALIAAVIVRLQVPESMSGGLEEHIGGSYALNFVNSSWSPVILAGITWYLIGTYFVELVAALWGKIGMHKK